MKNGTRNYHHDVGKKIKWQRKRRHHSKSGKNKNGTKEKKRKEKLLWHHEINKEQLSGNRGKMEKQE